jgi:hypothetical protein
MTATVPRLKPGTLIKTGSLSITRKTRFAIQFTNMTGPEPERRHCVSIRMAIGLM